jgi:hypothetical protein
VVYETGDVGSSLRDLLTFHLVPDDDLEKPPDFDQFEQFIQKKKQMIKKPRKKKPPTTNTDWITFTE